VAEGAGQTVSFMEPATMYAMVAQGA